MSSRSVLINETAARRFGWDNPVGKRIRELDDRAIQKTIVGVVRDFHFMDVRRVIEPMMINLRPEEAGALAVRSRSGERGRRDGRASPGLEEDHERNSFRRLSPGERPGSSSIRPEERLARLFVSFSLLAVLIACLGLIGMAAHYGRAADQGDRDPEGPGRLDLEARVHPQPGHREAHPDRQPDRLAARLFLGRWWLRISATGRRFPSGSSPPPPSRPVRRLPDDVLSFAAGGLRRPRPESEVRVVGSRPPQAIPASGWDRGCFWRASFNCRAGDQEL